MYLPGLSRRRRRGNTFREVYRRIHTVFPKPPQERQFKILALSATCTAETRRDVERCLHMDGPFVYIDTVLRSNISLSVQCLDGVANPQGLLRDRVNRFVQRGVGALLVYVPDRTECVTLWAMLHSVFPDKVLCTHAIMTDGHRQEVVRRMKDGQFRMLVCTGVFGMVSVC